VQPRDVREPRELGEPRLVEARASGADEEHAVRGDAQRERDEEPATLFGREVQVVDQDDRRA